MMKKTALFVLFICMIIAAVSGFPASSAPTGKQLHMGDLLTRVFAASGAQAEGYEVHNWSVFSNTFLPLDELVKIGRQLNTSLGIPNPREYKNSDDHQYVYQLYGNWDPETAVSLVLTSMNLEREPQTVLVIKVERKSGRLQDLVPAIERVGQTAAQAGGNRQISACIKGFRNDRMEIMERNELVGRMFASVQASEVEAFRSDWLASVSGYSPLAKTYIATNGKRMNLQVAVHDDAYQKRTRILVGTPILTVEY